MRFQYITLCLLFISIQSFGQERRGVVKLFNTLFNDTTIVAKPKFIAYPVVGFTPETSWEFGASGLFVYNAKNDLKNRLSELYAFTFFTLENQYGLWLHLHFISTLNYWTLDWWGAAR